MTFQTIIFEKGADGVATISLNRPERLNAFNQQMLDDMEAAWKIVREDEEIRAVVLRAVPGRAFCTGVDVVEQFKFYPGEPFRERDPGEKIGPKGNLVWKPVVAAVNGLCAGGAFYFINEADIIICSDDAQFFDPHVSFGLVPACEPIGVSHRMPYGEIMRMILLGNSERISAETARVMGLVSEVVGDGKLWERAHELAAIIAGKPTMATQGAVRAMWESLDMPHTAAVRNSYKYTQLNTQDPNDRSGFKKEVASIR
ncbi:MAG TPA: enoyl-CoA hydratase/isomerase family protein [Novosphingobium sp.]|nr:enoyl-CoA hydratase/isomerase family protein [Novosphingobium sp.]